MENYNTIFDFITTQETAFKQAIEPVDGWRWNFQEHVRTSTLYANSQLTNGKDEFTPVKNITRPILNLQHRTEDIEVKDVQIYVNDAEKYFLSFLVKKYHDNVFAPENDIGTFFDELNVSRIDYGGGLSKKLYKPRPEVVPLQSIAFCDQTDLLSGPIGIKHFYSPDQLLEMGANGWGNEANGATATLEEVIKLSRAEKKEIKDGVITKTPGRYIEVYEVHGNLPKRFADPNDTSEAYETRIYICCFYQKKDTPGLAGIILYTKPEPENPFKLVKRDPVYGRALGFGGAEELFEAQVWVNYDMIRMQDMLDAASKTILLSTDPTFTQKNSVKNMASLEVADIAPGTEVKPLDTFPRNLALFERSIAEWEAHAKEMGASQDPLQGASAPSGTPFVALQAQIQQGMGLHEYRRLQYAAHLEEIYRDWIIPHIEKKICEGSTFLAELTLDELQMVSEALITCQANYYIKEKVLNGETVDPQEVDAYKQQVAGEFKKRGNKHFIEILKGEFKNTDLGVKVSIAGKSKDIAAMMDKLTSVMKFMFANPYLLQSAPIAKLFNQVVEYAGLDPIDLSGFQVPPIPARRITTSIDYKDLQPQDQQALLKLDGIQSNQGIPMPQQTASAQALPVAAK